MFSDSAELLFLSERFSQIEDGELRTENIKRRIDLMWKFVKPSSTPVKVVSAPSNGTATVKEDGTIDYKPNAQFAGEDSFTYTVRESSGMESEETSVSIVVNDTIADPAPVVEEPKKKSSSGSLAWLTLLAAPFAFMRRRKQK